MAQLVTLRLAIPADHLDSMRRHPLLKRAGAPLRSSETLVYYDTAQGSLARRGLRLFLRRNGVRWVQTLTARPGIAHRAFWESDYSNGFEFSAVSDPEIRGWLQKPKLIGRLRAVSECSFRRTCWLLEPSPDARIQVRLDRGWIAAAGRRMPVSELTLALENGAPTQLYDLALALAERNPVFPESLSKAARGERLAAGAERTPATTTALRLERDLTPLTAFRAIALECLAHLNANRDGALNSGDPEFVHQMRVATRRLRAAMRLFKPVLPAVFADALNASLRDLMGVLGRTRDLDVLITEIINPVAAAMPGEPRLAALLAVVTERLYQARRAAVSLLDRSAYACLLLNAGRQLNSAPFVAGPGTTTTCAADGLPEPLQIFAERRLQRLLRAVRQLAASARIDDPASLHALRIGIKRLRYALEFFGSMTPGRSAERVVRRLARLQEELGQWNDLANAGEILMSCAARDSALREAATLIGGWHGARYAELLAAIPAQLAAVERIRIPRFAGRK